MYLFNYKTLLYSRCQEILFPRGRKGEGGGDGEGEVGGGEEGDESDDTISLLTSYPESDKTHPSHKSRGM